MGNDVNETVWTCIDPQDAAAAELSSLLKVMVLLDDAPAHFGSVARRSTPSIANGVDRCEHTFHITFGSRRQQSTQIVHCLMC
jgi:hypothetical protein